MTGIDRTAFAESARRLGEEYVARGDAASLYDINSGCCEDWALELIGEYGGERDGLELCWADNLSVDGRGDEWDVAMVERLFPATHPTHGLGWADVLTAMPAHCWVDADGRFYDAECPEGTDNIFEIPLLARMLARIAEERAAAPGP